MSTAAQIRQMDQEADEAAAAEYERERLEWVEPPTPPTVVTATTTIADSKPPLIDEHGKPTREGWRLIGKLFRKELPHKERTGRGGMKFSYIDARQVQNVLDGVVGPGNWESRWSVVRADHPVCARVGIGVYGVWKWDVGYSNNPEADEETDRSYELEPLKAAVSDGFKRAAVMWGIGRFLYGK